MAGCMRFMQLLSLTQCAPVLATRTTCHALTDVVSACAGVAQNSNVAAAMMIQDCPHWVIRSSLDTIVLLCWSDEDRQRHGSPAARRRIQNLVLTTARETLPVGE